MLVQKMREYSVNLEVLGEHCVWLLSLRQSQPKEDNLERKTKSRIETQEMDDNPKENPSTAQSSSRK